MVKWLSALLAFLASRLRPLFKLPAIPGWAVILWEIVDHSSRVEFVTLKGWRVIKSIFTFLSENPNARLLFGLAWLTLVVVFPKGLFKKLKAQFSSPKPPDTELSKPASESPDCPYEWTHAIAEHQARNIRDFVSVSRVGVWKHKLQDPVPTIRWGFMVKNNSIFPISLVEVRNNILFEETELAERRFDSTNEVDRLPPWREGSVVFEQRLSGPESQHLKSSPDGKFRFSNLVIMVGNKKTHPVVEPQQLSIGNDLETTLDRITYQETEGTRSLRKERDYLKSRLKELGGSDLTFEIDTDQSQVHTEGGTAVRRIKANVRVRCTKVAERQMAIREFHAALLRQDRDESEQVVVPKEALLRVLKDPDMNAIDFSGGWTINEPLTPFRWLEFYLELTPQQEELSSKVGDERIKQVAYS
jgi:hypothetical protein